VLGSNIETVEASRKSAEKLLFMALSDLQAVTYMNIDIFALRCIAATRDKRL
jgi:hypothetical protein